MEKLKRLFLGAWRIQSKPAPSALLEISGILAAPWKQPWEGLPKSLVPTLGPNFALFGAPGIKQPVEFGVQQTLEERAARVEYFVAASWTSKVPPKVLFPKIKGT